MRSIKHILLISVALLLSACVEDLVPESKDIRSSENLEVIVSDNFNILSTEEIVVSLEEQLASYDSVVLYFTMWCTTCSSHMDEINYKMDAYPNVRFLMVDFISSSISQAQNYQRDNGYKQMTTLVDNNDILQKMYDGKMASTIIINRQQEIIFNEVYKSRLYEVLDNL
jgi:thiol-disulfide isomerase/thioredoxin